MNEHFHNFDSGRVAPSSATRPSAVGNPAFRECRVNQQAALISRRLQQETAVTTNKHVQTNNMKNTTRITLSLATGALLLSAAVARAGIIGSPHDFSGESWNTKASDQHTVCSVCHTPHHSDANLGPLWNHTPSGGGFTMYNNLTAPGATLQATTEAAPAASSLACLSCHDGTIAVSAYGGSPSPGASGTITNRANLGKDLSHSHPISFTYDAPLTTLDKWLFNPDTKTVTPPVSGGGAFVSGSDMTVNGFLLNGNHRVECSSCHDVHNQEGSPFDIVNNPKLVKIVGVDANTDGSLLCRSCHNK